MGNTFKMLLENEFGESDAENDLLNTFESLVTTDADHNEDSLNDEKDITHGKPDF